jgi:hypothetical protein
MTLALFSDRFTDYAAAMTLQALNGTRARKPRAR